MDVFILFVTMQLTWVVTVVIVALLPFCQCAQSHRSRELEMLGMYTDDLSDAEDDMHDAHDAEPPNLSNYARERMAVTPYTPPVYTGIASLDKLLESIDDKRKDVTLYGEKLHHGVYFAFQDYPFIRFIIVFALAIVVVTLLKQCK
jgi:hypothetical protein